jgi:hypothetical protein
MHNLVDPMYWIILAQILLSLPSTIADVIYIIDSKKQGEMQNSEKKADSDNL